MTPDAQFDAAKLDSIPLTAGTHADDPDNFCVVEKAVYRATEGKKKTDKAADCNGSPALVGFLISWNDSLAGAHDTAALERLNKLYPRVINSAGSKAVEEKRAWLARDWYVRTFVPTWLELANLHEHAAALRGLNELLDDKDLPSATDKLSAARSAARSAAESAAWSAAWSAASSAASAWNAAESAAGSAAWNAARSAAGSAAWNAARSAAGSAADQALAPTVKRLQKSAFELLERMFSVGG